MNELGGVSGALRLMGVTKTDVGGGADRVMEAPDVKHGGGAGGEGGECNGRKRRRR